MIKGIDNFQYELEYKLYKASLRDLTGRDLFWIKANNIDLADIAQAHTFYNRLLIEENIAIEELEMDDYTAVVNDFYSTVLESKFYGIDDFMEVIYFCNGQQFTAEWAKWLDVPLSVINAMYEVIKKHPPTKLV